MEDGWTYLFIVAEGVDIRNIELAGVLQKAKKMRADRTVGEPRILKRARP
jgi:hypothetical protein